MKIRSLLAGIALLAVLAGCGLKMPAIVAPLQEQGGELAGLQRLRGTYYRKGHAVLGKSLWPAALYGLSEKITGRCVIRDGIEERC